MKDTALFALSSPEGSQNYFSKLINLKVGGQPFFRVCDCQMICEDCRKLEREKQILCNHVKQTAHWLSSKKGDRLKLLYAADPATAIKEFGGIIEDEFVPCFPKNMIERMFSLPPVVTSSVPQYIFVCVDPSGGGMSHLAICTGYYDERDFVVSFFQSEANGKNSAESADSAESSDSAEFSESAESAEFPNIFFYFFANFVCSASEFA